MFNNIKNLLPPPIFWMFLLLYKRLKPCLLEMFFFFGNFSDYIYVDILLAKVFF